MLRVVYNVIVSFVHINIVDTLEFRYFDEHPRNVKLRYDVIVDGKSVARNELPSNILVY